MKTLLLIAASALPLGIFAQPSAEPADLSVLRKSWTKAHLQAAAPVDQKYLQGLEVLKTKYTRSGKLEDALVIDAEIKSVTATQSSNGADAKLPDLSILCANWTKARLQAVAPIDQKYLLALESLKAKYTQAVKLEEALAIDAEIKSVVAAQSSKGADKKLTRGILCNTAWTYHIPAEGNSWTYEFSKDSKVLVNKNLFGSWSLTGNILRIESSDNGRLWMEYSLELKTNDQRKHYVEEIGSSKGKRTAVTLTQK